MPQGEIKAADVRRALDSLLGWPEIARSPQLARFLTYIVEKKLSGEEAAIKAYAIAVDVFGRPPSFDPQADPIVRVQARRLRTLLDQYRAEGHGDDGVMISLPVGRYVPEFTAITPGAPWPGEADPADGAPEPDPADSAAPPLPGQNVQERPRRLRWLRVQAVLVLAVLIGVVGAIVGQGLYRQQGQPQTGVAMPAPPRVDVAPLTDMATDPAGAVLAGQLRPALAEALERFESVTVIGAEGANRPLGHGEFRLSGVVRDGEFGPEVTLMLERQSGGRDPVETSPIVWSRTVSVPEGMSGDPGAATRSAAQRVASLLASFRGPLHELGRGWLNQYPALTPDADEYVCLLQFHRAREQGRDGDIALARSCFDRHLQREPDAALSLAAWATLEAVVAVRRAPASQPLAEAARPAMVRAREAAALMPESSFVQEQVGQVLAAQRETAAARAAFEAALLLNPANQDARAAIGYLEALAGEDDFGLSEAAEARAGVMQPPPWYLVPDALDAMRRGDYDRAVDLAERIGASAGDLGPILELAAAGAGRNEALADGVLSRLMADEGMRRSGMTVALASTMGDRSLLKAIRDGLIMAGVPASALDRPY